MVLSTEEIIAYLEENPEKIFWLGDCNRWVAAQCASQLAGVAHKMEDFLHFSDHCIAYKRVSLEYCLFSSVVAFNYPFGITGKRVLKKFKKYLRENKWYWPTKKSSLTWKQTLKRFSCLVLLFSEWRHNAPLSWVEESIKCFPTSFSGMVPTKHLTR